jgi:hypothetical protein
METDFNYVLLEEGIVHTVLLTKDEAEKAKEKWQLLFPYLSYTIIYDQYYEFREYEKTETN